MKFIFGILLCSHGGLAQGLLDATEMIAGQQPFIQAFGFNEGDELSSYQDRLLAQVNLWKSQVDRIVCLCDLKGATPYNACCITFAMENTILVSGMNLPLVLKLVAMQQNTEGKQAVETVILDQDILPKWEECEVLFSSLK